MAKRFLTHLDLSGNQLLNATFEKLTSDPTTGNFEGRMYYNTTHEVVRLYDGEEWVGLGAIKGIQGTENEIVVTTDVDEIVTISLPDTINANTTGNAATATTLETARTISLGGDLSGSASFNGGSDIQISATVNTDSVELGVDTTGDYVESVSASGAGVSVTGTGEGASVVVENTGVTSIAGTNNEIEVSASAGSVTVGLPNDVTIGNDLTVSGDAIVEGNLTISGITTTVDTEQILLADNIITLNSNLSASATPTENAGIEINRGSASAVALRWNETADVWEATTDGSTYNTVLLSGDTAASDISDFDEAAQDAVGGMVANTATVDLTYTDGTPELKADVNLQAADSYLVSASGLAVDLPTLEAQLVTDSFTKKATANVGNNVNTSFAVTHNLGTRDVQVQVYDNSTFDTVEVDVVRTDANNVAVSFSNPPQTDAYRVVVIG